MDAQSLPHARATDPLTSHLAGVQAAYSDSDQRVSMIVAGILSDGVARTDEEITVAASVAGLTETADRLRHGRLMLQKQGRLLLVGKRHTECGSLANVWTLNQEVKP